MPLTESTTELLLLSLTVLAALLLPTVTLPNESELVDRLALCARALGVMTAAMIRRKKTIPTRVNRAEDRRVICAFVATASSPAGKETDPSGSEIVQLCGERNRINLVGVSRP
jgi:hypothetical protein